VTEQTKAEAGQTQSDPERDAAFKALVDKANRGDKQALAELRRVLDANPEIWQRAGDLAAYTEQAWIDLLSNGSHLVAESVKRRLAALKADLAGECPLPLEELLTSQVTTTWLSVQHAEMEAAGPAGGSLNQAAFRLKRAESAQKRHLHAIKTLATLRALVPQGMAPIDSVRIFGEERKRA